MQLTSPAIESCSVDEFGKTASVIRAQFAEQPDLTVNTCRLGRNREGHHVQITHPCTSRIKLKIAVVIGVISENLGGILKGLFVHCSLVVDSAHRFDFRNFEILNVNPTRDHFPPYLSTSSIEQRVYLKDKLKRKQEKARWRASSVAQAHADST
jgi:hypothetical protein